jgi:hypothetical protein
MPDPRHEVPLIVTEDQVPQATEILERSISETERGPGWVVSDLSTCQLEKAVVR